MLRLRPYEDMDASTILSWCKDERAFYKWSAGMLGTYPATMDRFYFVKTLTPMVAENDNGIVGFFTLRKTGASPDELRMGFVILDPEKRGKGYGKEMLRLGLAYAFRSCGAKRVSLGVFENNAPAYYCYKAAGFEDVIRETEEIYHIMNEDWKFLELQVERKPMTHYMNLHAQPFEMIASGEKTIELRLNDEKRQKLEIGDTIVFACGERTLRVTITALHKFASFEELYRALPLDKCGYLPEELATASPKDMEVYYSPKQQEKYGVLGIGIERTE